MIDRFALIYLITILFYLKSITYKYVSDDLPASRRPHDPVKWKHWLNVLEGKERHSLQADHTLTIFLHGLVSSLIYVAFGSTPISFWGAILFALNPVTNQGSVWIAGRSYVWPSLGMLVTLAVPILAPGSILFTTYFNHGFVTPLALLGSPHPWTAAVIPFCWAFHFKRMRTNILVKAERELFHEDKQIKIEKAILAVKTFGYYLTISLVPLKNTFYHSFLQSAAGSLKHKAYTTRCRFFWIGLASLIAMIAYLVTVPWNIMSFGLLWWIIGIAPFLNVVRIHQEIAERYCYLPAIGLMVSLAYVTQGHPFLTGLFVGCYAVKAWFYMDAYTDDYYLVEHARLNSPDSWFAWHVAGMKRWDAGSRKEAIIMWTMARMINPREFKVNFNIASALTQVGHGKEGLGFLKVAEENIVAGQEKESKQLIAEFRSGKMAILL